MSMKTFYLEIKCEGAAFKTVAGVEPEPDDGIDDVAEAEEIARILRQCADSIEQSAGDSITLRDRNGNRVGLASFVQ
jgi:hypothetical protein